MNKIIYYISLLLFFVFHSCEKDTVNPSTEIDQIIDNEQSTLQFRSPNSFSAEAVHGFLVVEEKDYINAACELLAGSNIAIYSRFDDTTSHVGSWNINGQSIQLINDANGYRHLLRTNGIDPLATAFRADMKFECKFESRQVSEYASFEQSFTLAEKMCVTSPTLQGDDILPANQDLVLNWNTDPDVEEVYVAICSPGIPCLIKSFDDNLGTATIPATEYSGIPSGAEVFLNVGRALVSTVTNTSGKNIAIIRVQWANDPLLIME